MLGFEWYKPIKSKHLKEFYDNYKTKLALHNTTGRANFNYFWKKLT